MGTQKRDPKSDSSKKGESRKGESKKGEPKKLKIEIENTDENGIINEDQQKRKQKEIKKGIHSEKGSEVKRDLPAADI